MFSLRPLHVTEKCRVNLKSARPSKEEKKSRNLNHCLGNNGVTRQDKQIQIKQELFRLELLVLRRCGVQSRRTKNYFSAHSVSFVNFTAYLVG